jgi:hypothetical protein
MDFLKSGMAIPEILTIWKRSNSSITSIFIYIFMSFIVLVTNFIKSNYTSSLNEEVNAACIQKQSSTNLV